MAGLPWMRLDVGWHRNPKLLRLISDGKWRAAVVWVAGVGHCVEHGTDGIIDKAALPLIHGRPADARDLVSGGLWRVVPRGWETLSFGEYQQLSITTTAVHDTRSESGSKGNCIRWHGEDCGCWKAGGSTALRSVR